jgi:phosphate starvation-inducible PhoH-like protein
LFTREIEKVVITRPTVAKEDIGWLPGDLKEKMDPWLAPIYSNLEMLYDKPKIEKLLTDGIIEILPFAFMRGRTLTNSCVVVDEAQNVTMGQMEMVLGRLGIGSKMIICGDTSQIDLKNKKESGLDFMNTLAARVEGVKVISLKQNHRHPIVPSILDVYREYTT